MTLAKKRRPFSKVDSRFSRLKDPDIQELIIKLENLRKSDFLVAEDFESLKPILNDLSIEKLKLCKFLYCVGYKKELFLHLGIILESYLNSIVNLYIVEDWQPVLNFTNKTALDKNFEEFINIKSLSEKANTISRFNLFNNVDASERIKNKIQAFRVLRNYGGHSKSLNSFLDSILLEKEDMDREVIDVFSLLREIDKAVCFLKSNPPSVISDSSPV